LCGTITDTCCKLFQCNAEEFAFSEKTNVQTKSESKRQGQNKNSEITQARATHHQRHGKPQKRKEK